MEKTAVEWLVEELPIRIRNMHQSDIEKAKEMEKIQTIKLQIEVLEKAWIAKPPVDELIYELEQQLKELEDGIITK